MSDIRPAGRFTIEQLLDALRERVISILFVDFSPVATVGRLTTHQPEQTYRPER